MKARHILRVDASTDQVGFIGEDLSLSTSVLSRAALIIEKDLISGKRLESWQLKQTWPVNECSAHPAFPQSQVVGRSHDSGQHHTLPTAFSWAGHRLSDCLLVASKCRCEVLQIDLFSQTCSLIGRSIGDGEAALVREVVGGTSRDGTS